MSIKLAENSCTGCTTCAERCPQKCICMKPNDEGFLYPEIDKTACVECGLCEKDCPVLHKPMRSHDKTVAYSAYSKDIDNRLSSSSGGIFSLLANEVLDDGGIVYGAAFDDCFNVHHIGVETKDELGKLRGSKYVQSNLDNVFYNVKIALDSGRKVLFSGVICQIAGLKAYLKCEYPNLFTVDVLCHGVPSPKLWRKYINYLEGIYGASVRRLSFRSKKYGWKTYSLSFAFSNNKEYTRIYNKDPYMQMYLQNICLRPSCYECRFNEIDRLSDITLGDCWGIGKTMPDMDDDRGTSVVLIHSENGKDYFDKIKQHLIIQESEVDNVLPPNFGGRQAVKPHKNRTEFFARLAKGESFEKLHSLVVLPLYQRCWKKIKHLLKRIIQVFIK